MKRRQHGSGLGRGHRVQLMRLRKAWDGLQITYLSTELGLVDIVKMMARDEGNPVPKFASVTDAKLPKNTPPSAIC